MTKERATFSNPLSETTQIIWMRWSSRSNRKTLTGRSFLPKTLMLHGTLALGLTSLQRWMYNSHRSYSRKLTTQMWQSPRSLHSTTLSRQAALTNNQIYTIPQKKTKWSLSTSTNKKPACFNKMLSRRRRIGIDQWLRKIVQNPRKSRKDRRDLPSRFLKNSMAAKTSRS